VLDDGNDSDNNDGKHSSQWRHKAGGVGSGGGAGSGERIYGGVGLGMI